MQKTSRPQRRPPTTVPKERSAHDAELVDEMSEFLDEVDTILEQEEQFLTRYRQRSGQ